MKSYRTLAWRELCAQKVTSILILIAVVLSTVITTVIGQSIGILNAMKEQQAAAFVGKKYGSFVQLSEEQLAEVKSDSRFSYVGAAIDLGTIQLNSQLKLSLVEYPDHSYEMYPAFTELLEGRLPEHPMEIALSEDVLRFLGFQGKVGDRISLTASKSWRHGILPAVDYTEEFTLTGITKSTTYLSYEDTDRQLAESYEQIRLLAWGLILFVGLIGLLNIVNTVYTNIHTRVTEIGMQRAIGMSHEVLYQTFLWEGAYYGIIAAVIGGVTGYICTIFVEAARTDTIQPVSIPVVSLAEAAVMSVLACLIATCIPLRRIAKMSIVDSIETVG